MLILKCSELDTLRSSILRAHISRHYSECCINSKLGLFFFFLLLLFLSFFFGCFVLFLVAVGLKYLIISLTHSLNHTVIYPETKLEK